MQNNGVKGGFSVKDGKNSESSRLLTIIGLILLILGIALLSFNNSEQLQKFRQLTENFTYSLTANAEETAEEALPDEAQEKIDQAQAEKAAEEAKVAEEDDTSVAEDAKEKMVQLSDELGITKALNLYNRFRQFMEQLEDRIQDFNNPLLIILCLLVLFATKSFVSFVPVNVTCILAGVCLPFPVALIVNIVGLAGIFAIKYFWGKSRPSNSIHTIMKKIPLIEKIVSGDMVGATKGNPVLLFALRLVPSVPINPISQLYGFMEFDFVRFLVLSILGMSVKLISYTCIGSNVSNPISAAFMLPIAILLIVSGVSSLAMAFFLGRRRRQFKRQEKKVQQFGEGLEFEQEVL